MKKILIALIIIFAGFGVKSQQVALSEYRWTPVDEEGVVSGRQNQQRSAFLAKDSEKWRYMHPGTSSSCPY